MAVYQTFQGLFDGLFDLTPFLSQITPYSICYPPIYHKAMFSQFSRFQILGTCKNDDISHMTGLTKKI